MMSKPWLKNYDRGVPHTLRPYPERTLLEVLNENARLRPDHRALTFKGATLTWAELDQLSNCFGAALVEQGVQKGDRLTPLLPNCPQSLICQLGAWKAGAIVSPLNPLYTAPELTHALLETGAETAVVLTPFYRKLKALQPDTNLRRIVATNIKEYLSPLSRLLFTFFREKKEGHRVRLESGDLWLVELMSHSLGADRPPVAVDPQDPALLMFTGGTTGRPKAALSSHQGLLIAGKQLHAWIGDLKEDWHDVNMLLMPMFHTYGNVGVFSASLVGRQTMAVIPNPRDFDDVIATIRQVRPAYVSGVPTLFTALLNHPKVQAGQVDFRSIKLCISGAAPLMAETKRRFESLTGGHMIEGYALTESVMAAVLTPVQGTYKDCAVGLPLPDVEIRIADLDTGQGGLSPGEVGEILIRAPQLMLGYWRRPEETAATLRDGWLHTGDTGLLDEEGYLHIVDRTKDLIKSSGFQVWPREVEEVIAAHPAVAEVGVAGIPDEHQGEAVKAWVVLNKDQELTCDELRSYCRERLVAYKVPRHVEFCEALPKSAVGKVLRRSLVEAEKAVQDELALTGEDAGPRGQGAERVQ